MDAIFDKEKRRTDLVWHVGTYLIINGMLAILDWVIDGRMTWAFWIALFWGVALLFHVLFFVAE